MGFLGGSGPRWAAGAAGPAILLAVIVACGGGSATVAQPTETPTDCRALGGTWVVERYEDTIAIHPGGPGADPEAFATDSERLEETVAAREAAGWDDASLALLEDAFRAGETATDEQREALERLERMPPC